MYVAEGMRKFEPASKFKKYFTEIINNYEDYFITKNVLIYTLFVSMYFMYYVINESMYFIYMYSMYFIYTLYVYNVSMYFMYIYYMSMYFIYMYSMHFIYTLKCFIFNKCIKYKDEHDNSQDP